MKLESIDDGNQLIEQLRDDTKPNGVRHNLAQVYSLKRENFHRADLTTSFWWEWTVNAMSASSLSWTRPEMSSRLAIPVHSWSSTSSLAT